MDYQDQRELMTIARKIGECADLLLETAAGQREKDAIATAIGNGARLIADAIRPGKPTGSPWGADIDTLVGVLNLPNGPMSVDDGRKNALLLSLNMLYAIAYETYQTDAVDLMQIRRYLGVLGMPARTT